MEENGSRGESLGRIHVVIRFSFRTRKLPNGRHLNKNILFYGTEGDSSRFLQRAQVDVPNREENGSELIVFVVDGALWG